MHVASSQTIWRSLVYLSLLAAMPSLAQNPVKLRPNPNIEPLRDPRFVRASEAMFLKDTDRVLGININGIAKAYQPHVVSFHHVIQDRLRDWPILVTW
jgi:hypothetical protein